MHILVKILQHNEDFVKGIFAGVMGLFVGFSDHIVDGLKIILIVISIIYTSWKFYTEFWKRRRERKRERKKYGR